MARHPNAIDRINYVEAFIVDSCDAPFSVYVQTFLPAFLELVLSYYALDLVQIVSGYLSPRRALGRRRGGGHRRGRPNRGRSKTRIGRWARIVTFDPWDHLGKRLGNLSYIGGRTVSGGVLNLWVFYGVIQRVAYWWFIVEITSTFFYKWFSAVNQSFYCQAQRNGWLHAEGPGHTATGLLSFWPTPLPTVLKQRGPVHWNIVSGGYTGRSGSFMFSAGVGPVPGLPYGPDSRIAVKDLSSGQEWESEPSDDPSKRHAIGIKVTPGHEYAVGSRGSLNRAITDPSVTIVGLDHFV